MDDSAVVDDMFGFLENQNDNMSESQAPSAFRYKIDYIRERSAFASNLQIFVTMFIQKLVITFQ